MRLRDPRYDVGTKVCGAKHIWLHFPKHGADMYDGPRVKSVASPSEVRDDRISKSCYAGR